MQNRKRTDADIRNAALNKKELSAYDRAVRQRRGLTGLDSLPLESGPKKVEQIQRIPNSYKRYSSVDP